MQLRKRRRRGNTTGLYAIENHNLVRSEYAPRTCARVCTILAHRWCEYSAARVITARNFDVNLGKSKFAARNAFGSSSNVMVLSLVLSCSLRVEQKIKKNLINYKLSH